jgi:hypothetical protein
VYESENKITDQEIWLGRLFLFFGERSDMAGRGLVGGQLVLTSAFFRLYPPFFTTVVGAFE